MRLISKGSTVYYARIHPETAIYDLCELHVRTIYPDIFVGVDTHTKMAHICSFEDCDVTIFDNREEALKVVQAAEQNKKNFTIDNEDD